MATFWNTMNPNTQKPNPLYGDVSTMPVPSQPQPQPQTPSTQTPGFLSQLPDYVNQAISWMGDPSNAATLGQIGGLLGEGYGGLRGAQQFESLPEFTFDPNSVYSSDWNQKAMDQIKNQVQSASMARGNPFGNRGLQEIADTTYARHLLPATQMAAGIQQSEADSRFRARLAEAQAKAGFWNNNVGGGLAKLGQTLGDKPMQDKLYAALGSILSRLGGGGAGGGMNLENLDGMVDQNFYNDLMGQVGNSDYSLLNNSFNPDDYSTYNWADNFSLSDLGSYDYQMPTYDTGTDFDMNNFNMGGGDFDLSSYDWNL